MRGEDRERRGAGGPGVACAGPASTEGKERNGAREKWKYRWMVRVTGPMVGGKAPGEMGEARAGAVKGCTSSILIRRTRKGCLYAPAISQERNDCHVDVGR